jgi:probable O-glycosylation ligase (exosortase A-associated)
MLQQNTDRNFKLSRQAPKAGFGIVVAYFFFEFGRFQDYIEPLKYLKIPFIISLLVIVILIKQPDKSIYRDKQIVYHGIFIFLMAVSIFYAVNTHYAYQSTVGMFTIFLVGVLPTVAYLNSVHRISRFYRAWIGLFVFLSIMTILHDGHGPGGFLLDENDMALALNMAIPYAFYLNKSPAMSSFWKMICLGAMLLMVLAVVATSSRGGFLGLAAVILGLVFFSQKRIKNFLLLVLLAATSLLFVPDSYLEEVESISDQTDSTRLHRFYFWGLGWDMFVDNPVLGVGAANYPWTNRRYELKRPNYDQETTRWAGGRSVHSLYFQLLSETGLVGVFLYVSLGFMMYRRMKAVAEDADGVLDGDLGMEVRLIAKAIQVSMFGLLVSGAFISVLHYPHYWYLNGFSLAIYLVYKKAGMMKAAI